MPLLECGQLLPRLVMIEIGEKHIAEPNPLRRDKQDLICAIGRTLSLPGEDGGNFSSRHSCPRAKEQTLMPMEQSVLVWRFFVSPDFGGKTFSTMIRSESVSKLMTGGPIAGQGA